MGPKAWKQETSLVRSLFHSRGREDEGSSLCKSHVPRTSRSEETAVWWLQTQVYT